MLLVRLAKQARFSSVRFKLNRFDQETKYERTIILWITLVKYLSSHILFFLIKSVKQKLNQVVWTWIPLMITQVCQNGADCLRFIHNPMIYYYSLEDKSPLSPTKLNRKRINEKQFCFNNTNHNKTRLDDLNSNTFAYSIEIYPGLNNNQDKFMKLIAKQIKYMKSNE